MFSISFHYTHLRNVVLSFIESWADPIVARIVVVVVVQVAVVAIHFPHVLNAVSRAKPIIQTFNFNLETNKELTLDEIIKIYELNKDEVQNKIDKDIQIAQNKSEDLIKLGYNVFSRDIKSEIYNVENINEYFIYNNNIYIIFAYGNDKMTSEMDLVII